MAVNYFKDSEFACKCGCGFCKPDARLISTLNKIRETLGKPVVVTSGCRCTLHNANEGGVRNRNTPLVRGRAGEKGDSNHTHGTAADIQCPGMSAVAVWGVILRLYRERWLPELAGLGIYNTFVHVDISPKEPGRLRQWDERS